MEGGINGVQNPATIQPPWKNMGGKKQHITNLHVGDLYSTTKQKEWKIEIIKSFTMK